MGKVGRPKAFKSVKEVEEKINAYFNYCEEKEKPYTMSGLAYYLGIDRKTLLNYSKDEEYFHTIKKARDRVQMQLEENALSNKANPTFTIFNLKNNFDWKDNNEVKTNVEITKVDELLSEIKNSSLK
ncbi:MAG: terminase small subunit [Candidatus Onthovivens sp.]|nr:terminase small subunit [Candidatus Onthovivens sp.]